MVWSLRDFSGAYQLDQCDRNASHPLPLPCEIWLIVPSLYTHKIIIVGLSYNYLFFILLVTEKKRKTIWTFFIDLCDIWHVFKMSSKSIHEYRAFTKVFEYNTNNFLWILNTHEYPKKCNRIQMNTNTEYEYPMSALLSNAISQPNTGLMSSTSTCMKAQLVSLVRWHHHRLTIQLD